MNIAPILLCFVLLIEVLFAILGIQIRKGKLNLCSTTFKSIRCWFRIGALSAFLLLSFTTLLDLNAKWYGFLLLLIILTIQSILHLRSHKTPADQSAFRIVLSSTSLFLVFFLTLIPPLYFHNGHQSQ